MDAKHRAVVTCQYCRQPLDDSDGASWPHCPACDLIIRTAALRLIELADDDDTGTQRLAIALGELLVP